MVDKVFRCFPFVQNLIPPPTPLHASHHKNRLAIIFFLLFKHSIKKRRKKMKNNLNDRLEMLVKMERLIVDEVSLCNVGDFEGCDEDEY
jgi:hypothetical protein